MSVCRPYIFQSLAYIRAGAQEEPLKVKTIKVKAKAKANTPPKLVVAQPEMYDELASLLEIDGNAPGWKTNYYNIVMACYLWASRRTQPLENIGK